MRVLVIGGTRFVGRAIVTALHGDGHEVLVVHRGEHEPPDLVPVSHLHCERTGMSGYRARLDGFDAAIDVACGNAADAELALRAVPDPGRWIAVSSVDVYRAYEATHTGTVTDALPPTERSPLRTKRFIDAPAWENLEVEESYLAAGAVVLRLGAVYGPYDYQLRHEAVLRRVRTRRPRIPCGTGNLLFSRVYVDDVADAVRRVLSAEGVLGEAFNVVETGTPSIELAMRQTIAAAEADLTVVRVPDTALPPDLRITRAFPQHLQASAAKLIAATGWRETDPATALRHSVRWHLANPPADADPDFGPDDAALALADQE